MRRTLASLCLIPALAIAAPAAAQQPAAPRKPIQVGLQRVLVAPPAPEVPQPPQGPKVGALRAPKLAAGPLRYRGGLSLARADRAFKGYADVWVSLDGARLVAIEGDAWVSGQLTYGPTGDLTALLPTNAGFLLDEVGKPYKADADRHAETLDFDNAKLVMGVSGPRFLIGFGDRGRIADYRGITAHALPVALPAAAPLSAGVAGLADLPGGGYVAFGADGRGWLSTPAGQGAVTLRPSDGWTLADVAALPDGDLLVVETKADAVRLSRVAGADLAIGKTLQPADLAAPLPLAHIQGAAARKGPKGETLIYLVSGASPAALYMLELAGS
jgi:hypothetical protein